MNTVCVDDWAAESGTKATNYLNMHRCVCIVGNYTEKLKKTVCINLTLTQFVNVSSRETFRFSLALLTYFNSCINPILYAFLSE